MPYQLNIPKRVRREIERLPGHMRQRIKRVIASLCDAPRPTGAQELKEPQQGYWRIRIENYRIVYTIDDEGMIVNLKRVGQRGPNTYRDLP